jgi:hypothetical protein
MPKQWQIALVLARDTSTRRLVNRLLDQDADDQAWADQVGPVYRQGDVAGLLGKSKQAVSGDRRLLRLELRSGTTGYPAFQFDGRQQTPGLGAIVEPLLPVVETSWTIASWLTSPQPDLGDDRPWAFSAAAAPSTPTPPPGGSPTASVVDSCP